MKTKLMLLLSIMLLQFCKAQQTESKASLPKIENYTKGELELKTKAFGDNNPITIGKIMADGTIHLNWPEIDLTTINENKFWTKSFKRFTGGNFCKDPNAIIDNPETILVENKYLYVYKYNQAVGAIMPSTQKGQEHDNRQLGTTIDWVYSYTDANAKANCSVKMEWENLYSFNETTAYELKFRKGWNLVSYTLNEVEEYDENGQKRSLPKTKTVTSINKIPTDLHWHLKYWANDALLDIEQQLIKETPIANAQYETWLPKKLGNLKRTDYEIGKTIKRFPSLSNVNMLFKKGDKTLDLTIVDCTGSKDMAGGFTLIMEMASLDWKDDTKTGYRSASAMDDKRVITEYNEKEAKTTLSYNTNGRFIIKAEATNMFCSTRH